MRQFLDTLWNDESGQDLTEYVLLVVIIALGVTLAAIALREEIIAVFRPGSSTPVKPRCLRWARKPLHPALSSLAPSQMPRISRNPSSLTPMAISTETLRTSPAQLRFSTTPSR